MANRASKHVISDDTDASALKVVFPHLISLVKPDRSKLRIVAFDPGETTGACVLDGIKLIDARQIDTSDIHALETLVRLKNYIKEFSPDIVVYENYRVYAWESEKHKWAELHTPKLIGMIITLTNLQGIKLSSRMAQEAKNFATDEKLDCWGLRVKGKRHANDAIRHAVFELLFGK